MSILLDKSSRLVVQGITGRDGAFHTKKMKEYGTNVVAGVTPGKRGEIIDGTPVFNFVSDAVNDLGADTSIIFIPAPFVKDAIIEAIEAGIKLIICITEGVPVADMILAKEYASLKGAAILGPNCPGLISPGKALAGIMPGNIFMEGSTGVISRSGTLTYEVVYNLTQNGMGQSTAVGIGGDPVAGLYYEELLEMFQKDNNTDSIALIGEIGGDAEERAADFIKNNITKPVAVYIAGVSAPEGKRMGHAGAIISGSSGKASDKIDAFKKAGIPVAKTPSEIPALLKALK